MSTAPPAVQLARRVTKGTNDTRQGGQSTANERDEEDTCRIIAAQGQYHRLHLYGAHTVSCLLLKQTMSRSQVLTPVKRRSTQSTVTVRLVGSSTARQKTCYVVQVVSRVGNRSGVAGVNYPFSIAHQLTNVKIHH